MIGKALGLRARIVIVILLALAPSALVLGWGGWHTQQDVRSDAQERVLESAREAAAHQQDILDTAKNTLAVLSQTTSVRSLDDARCSATLASVKRSYGWMASLYVIDAAGRLHCTDDAAATAAIQLEQESFRSAIESRTLHVGEYQIGQFSALPVVPVVLPIFRSDGRLLFLVATNIKLEWTSALLARTRLPKGSVAIILEDDGTVLSASAGLPARIGQQFADKKLLYSLSVQEEGVVEMAGLDDVDRFYGFDRLEPGKAIVVVGIPRATVLAPVRQWIAYWLCALILSVALGVPLAWVAADRLVLRVTRRIATTAQLLAAGDDAARTGLAKAPCELGELARQFDNMAEHLSRSGRELQDAYDEERQANIAKIDFMARMSHELRTPLNAISGFAQLIRDQRFGPQAVDRYSDYASDIVKSSEHLLSMINELLDLAKIEANRVELHPVEILLPTFLGDTLRLLRGEADENQVRLELAPCQADLTLAADRRALTQILLNLLSNAIKYTPAGGRVRLSAVTRNRGVVIEVSDTGVGMSPEQVAQAFQAFVRSEDPLVRSREGTGLGLPIAKHLMELHGGRITLKSRPGRGTRATLWLPKKPSAQDTQAGDDSHNSPGHALAG